MKHKILFFRGIRKKRLLGQKKTQIQKQEDSATCLGRIKAIECYWHKVSEEGQ